MCHSLHWLYRNIVCESQLLLYNTWGMMGWRYGLVGNVLSCKHKDLSSIFQNPHPENQACWCTLVIQFWKFKNRWIPWVHWSVRLAYLMSLGPDETIFQKTRWADSEEWPLRLSLGNYIHTHTMCLLTPGDEVHKSTHTYIHPTVRGVSHHPEKTKLQGHV